MMVKDNAIQNLRSKFVAFIYADHNKTRSVLKSLAKVLSKLNDDTLAINIGSGESRLHPKIKNVDIFDGPSIDYVASVENLPFSNESVDIVISQETIEHVKDPFNSIKEIHRVLKKGGVLYLQLPFTIGYHPGPQDFWRFSREGIQELCQYSGLQCVELGFSVGSATGFYRIAVEFFAIVVSGPFESFYIPSKAVFSLLLFPIKWLDAWTALSKQNDRIAGGYYVIARKQ
jgi:SAM-dependent methyltransferase